MSLRLVLGGTRSGKSAHAEACVAAAGGAVIVIATGSPTDAEMAARIAAHRQRRPRGWHVVETDDLAVALAGVDPDAAVLVDDLDSWLTTRMLATGLLTDETVASDDDTVRDADVALRDDVAAVVGAVDRPGTTVIVAGQPGLGVTPLGAATRRYLDLHGDAVQRLAEAAADVEVVVAGRIQALRPRPGVRQPAGLRDHGDTQVPPGAADLAVNTLPGPPDWLRDRLAAALADLSAYPDPEPARVAAARRHGRPPGECLLLDGAAEGFWLLATTLRPRLAACVHPSFTEGEAALRAAGAAVVRVQRDPDGWSLDPATVPDSADLVVLGRPDNPTGARDPVATIEALVRPGRTVLVDEAFAELLPDAAGLAGRRDVPGLVCLRSLTKAWGLAGLRVGYLVGPAALVARLDAARQPWSVNHLALVAVEACVAAEDERRSRAAAVAADRAYLVDRLAGIPDLTVHPSEVNFVLVSSPLVDLRQRLLADGLAVRRGETFPGLDRRHVRVAVREPATTDRLVAALTGHLAGIDA